MKPMTESELQDLVCRYIHMEGYTDLRSIYSLMCQEYPDDFDKKLALITIRRGLREERN